MVLEYLHGTEGSGTGKGLVAEAGLVVVEVIALDLVVGLLRISWRERWLAGVGGEGRRDGEAVRGGEGRGSREEVD
jgi:hypothetical protein